LISFSLIFLLWNLYMNIHAIFEKISMLKLHNKQFIMLKILFQHFSIAVSTLVLDF
jgi:hypothetical protein